MTGRYHNNVAYEIPNQCTICNDTLLGPPPPSALVVAETDVHNRVRCYHKSCIERLARIAQSLNERGPFYGTTSAGSDSNAMQGAARQYSKAIDSDDDINDVLDTVGTSKTPHTGYLRTPYTNETFDDHRDKVIAELRVQLAALENDVKDIPVYMVQAVRVTLREVSDDVRKGRVRFNEQRGEWEKSAR